ncbi:molybdopterin-dependent oxidoreductase [uncultured Ilumatobacter sp.]|uniref:molybdopterin-dependent oxidoreductase n=1 Tax=uncultured Ilumatobacter sp. TaxID=879968 RepID=UPI00374F6834
MTDLQKYPPHEKWHDWTELDAKAWPDKVERNYTLVPTTCFNCEAACGLLAYFDNETGEIAKIEGNPEHPASRGRNCAKGPATINQIYDNERIMFPLKQTGERGSGEWERISWDQALTEIGGRIRTAFEEDRHNEVMYHVGRPGEDGYADRVLKAWGTDGHNSHTNICSSNARIGYQSWMGHDRPSSDFANAEVIFLISSHLEAGHYFNPHAQRIIEAQGNGATVICVDPRLSNTGSKADHWLPTWPGTEAFLCLSIAHLLLESGNWQCDFVRRWVNWETFLAELYPDMPQTFDSVEAALKDHYSEYTPERAEYITGVSADQIREIAAIIGKHPTKFASHNWRAAGAGNEGGWQVARCLFFLNVLTGSVGTEGGTSGNGWNKFAAHQPKGAPPLPRWNELSWPQEFPLSYHEMSILLPHFLNEGRGKLDTYFSRVYNPIWTNPDGFTWLEALKDPEKVNCHVALTPTWSETSWFADYVLPMGVGAERHDVSSYETHAGRWIGFRQSVFRRYEEIKTGKPVSPDARSHEFNPGEVWEENEFWIDLSWKIDPDGSMGIRQWFESDERPGNPISVDEYYGYIFAEEVPGLAEAAEAAGQVPLEYMRDRGSFAVPTDPYVPYEKLVSAEAVADCTRDERGVFRKPGTIGTFDGSEESFAATELAKLGDGSPAVEVDGEIKEGFPTPSKKLELFSTTLKEWGWPEYSTPKWIPSHVHWENLDLAGTERILLPTFRIPTLIHTRSANSKWLNEISHRHPLWIHPEDAEKLQIEESGLVRISTRIGHFVIQAWRTEGIRPGVVAASHHMGRWRLDETEGRNWAAGKATIDQQGTTWTLKREGADKKNMTSYESSDPDTGRIWWHDTGVHQNATFCVQPDPISGMQCWHQRVHVTPAQAGDEYGDVVVDTAKSREAYLDWMTKTRPAGTTNDTGLRRPLWYARPLKPTLDAYRLPQS